MLFFKTLCLLKRNILQIPAHCTGTKYRSRAAIESRDQELSLAPENLQYTLVVRFLERLHQEVTSLGKTTEEYECLRRAERSEISASLTQHLASEIIYSLSQSITLTSSYADIIRSNIFGFISRSKDGSSLFSRNSRAVRATPVAEQ